MITATIKHVFEWKVVVTTKERVKGSKRSNNKCEGETQLSCLLIKVDNR